MFSSHPKIKLLRCLTYKSSRIDLLYLGMERYPKNRKSHRYTGSLLTEAKNLWDFIVKASLKFR